MANTVRGNVIIVTTATDTLLVKGNPLVKLVRWVGSAAAGHVAEIADASGTILWEGQAPETRERAPESIAEFVAPGGIKVPRLDSGTLFIYLQV
jgi:hypothetical protein